MDKKVLAIVAIIAFHLALMWFIRGSLKPEELASGGDTRHPDISPVEPNPYLPQTTLAAELNASVPLLVEKPSRRTKMKISPPIRSAFRAARIVSNKSLRQSEDTISFPQPVFTDTVIWVKRAEVRPIYREPLAVKSVDISAKPVSKIAIAPKKKSFLKRSVRVVRKPYDWIKTLVSKL